MIGVLWAYEGWQFVTYSAGEVINAETKPSARVGDWHGRLDRHLPDRQPGLSRRAGCGGRGRLGSPRCDRRLDGRRPGGGEAGRDHDPDLDLQRGERDRCSPRRASTTRWRATGSSFNAWPKCIRAFRRRPSPIIAGAVWSAILALTGTFEQLLTYVVFIGWIFYALAAASVFVYRRRQPDAARPYRVPGYPLTPCAVHRGGRRPRGEHHRHAARARRRRTRHRPARRAGLPGLASEKREP